MKVIKKTKLTSDLHGNTFAQMTHFWTYQWLTCVCVCVLVHLANNILNLSSFAIGGRAFFLFKNNKKKNKLFHLQWHPSSFKWFRFPWFIFFHFLISLFYPDCFRMRVSNPRQEEPCPKLAAAFHNALRFQTSWRRHWRTRSKGSAMDEAWRAQYPGPIWVYISFLFKILILITKTCVYICMYI